jgi:hypothetical protein
MSKEGNVFSANRYLFFPQPPLWKKFIAGLGTTKPYTIAGILLTITDFVCWLRALKSNEGLLWTAVWLVEESKGGSLKYLGFWTKIGSICVAEGFARWGKSRWLNTCACGGGCGRFHVLVLYSWGLWRKILSEKSKISRHISLCWLGCLLGAASASLMIISRFQFSPQMTSVSSLSAQVPS